MGKKRRRENSEERIQRKIRKLAGKLKKYRTGIVYSSEDEYNYRDPSPVEVAASSPNEVYLLPPPLSPTAPPEAPPALSPTPVLSPTPPVPAPVTTPSAPSLPPPINTATEAEANLSGDAILDAEILQLLGEAPEPEVTFGSSVHKDIAARWHDVIKKGLSKDSKEKIFKDYLIPSNCELLTPPLLNPEAKAALPDTSQKRDASFVSRQKHLSVAIAALTDVSNKDVQKQDVLKPISDACRILCDMHHYETVTRKRFIVSSVNTGLKDALTNAVTDKFLFGENMSEKLKTAKTVQKSGEELKSAQKINNSKVSANNKNQGNYKTLHQKRPEAGRAPAGPRQQWKYQRGRTSSRPAAYHHAPPPARRAGRR